MSGNYGEIDDHWIQNSEKRIDFNEIRENRGLKNVETVKSATIIESRCCKLASDEAGQSIPGYDVSIMPHFNDDNDIFTENDSIEFIQSECYEKTEVTVDNEVRCIEYNAYIEIPRNVKTRSLEDVTDYSYKPKPQENKCLAKMGRDIFDRWPNPSYD